MTTVDVKGRKVRVGFIGTGAVTAYHHLPGLRLDPRAELVAICDTDPELLEKRKDEWNVASRDDRPRGALPIRTRSTRW